MTLTPFKAISWCLQFGWDAKNSLAVGRCLRYMAGANFKAHVASRVFGAGRGGKLRQVCGGCQPLPVVWSMASRRGRFEIVPKSPLVYRVLRLRTFGASCREYPVLRLHLAPSIFGRSCFEAGGCVSKQGNPFKRGVFPKEGL